MRKDFPTTPGPSRSLRFRDRRWLLIVPSLLLLCYLPLVLIPYGFSEDYRLLADYQRGATLNPHMLAEGRPGFAIWAWLVFGGLHSIRSLAIVRLGGILLLGGLGIAFALAWRAIGRSKFEAVVAGTLAMTLPSFQLFAATAAMGGSIVAAILGVGAAILTRKSLTAPSTRRRLAIIASAATLLLLGLATYQPGGLVFVTVAAIYLVAGTPPAPEFRRLATTFVLVAVPALIVEFAIFLVGRAAFRPYLLELRAGFALAPAHKALYFLFFPLPQALTAWKLRPDLFLAFGLMIALATGIALHVRGMSGWLERAGVALLLLPLAYLPNLAVIENHVSFRSIPALASLVLVYYLLVLHDQLGRTRPRAHRAVLCALAAIGLFSALRNTTRLVAIPQARELAAVRHTLAQLPESVTSIVVTPSDVGDSPAPAVLYDEFGYPSTALPWSTTNLSWLVMRELHPIPDTTAIRVRVAPAPQDTSPVIDWGPVLRQLRASGSSFSR